MIRPTLKQLNYLITLEQEKSFSRAAQRCNVTQSTLSAGIKDLETILEQQLVNRSGRSITLTSLGTEIADRAKAVLIDVDAIVSRANAQQTPLNGTIRLGIIPTIAPYILPTILPKMQQTFPNLELQLHEDISARLIELLHKRQIDAAIIALPYNSQGLEHHDLFEEPFYLATPKDYDLPLKPSIDSINPKDLLLLEDGHCLRDHALSACKLQLPARRKTFSATSLATLIQMVSHGFGITLLPEMVVKNAPMPKNIKTTPFASSISTRKIGIIWHTHTHQKRDLNALKNALRTYLS